MGDVPGGEGLDPAAALLNQLLAERLVADDPLELRRHSLRRPVLEEDPAVAERLRYCRRGVRDDGQIAAHGLEQRDTEALVLREGEERRRAAVIGDELLGGDAPGERHGTVETELADVAADTVEVTRGHAGRPDQVEVRGAIRLAVAGERRNDIVDRFVGED